MKHEAQKIMSEERRMKNEGFKRIFHSSLFTFHLIIVFVLALAACGNKQEEQAETMLKQAESQLANKQYGEAMRTIDSLRKAYPEAIDVRKRALTLYQDVALKQAQDDLAQADTALQRATKEYDAMKADVDKAKAANRATAEQLTSLTLKRMERDSLQVRFDVECAKIKYIHKKQKE